MEIFKEKPGPVQEEPALKEEKFSFSADDVLKTLKTPQGGTKIEYIGDAMSDFQAEPLIFDTDGKPIVFSDWEMEVAKNAEGRKSKIIIPQKPDEFPRFGAFKEDYIKRSAELGENMFRFSLDFARLCPQEGEFDEKLMADYVRALALIRANGEEPMLAIYHYPMPKYLLGFDAEGNLKTGGWEHPDVAKHFRFYVENVVDYLANEDKVSGALGDLGFAKNAQDKFLAEGLVRYFLSINEPTSIIRNNYLAGIFPPFRAGNVSPIKKVLEELIAAHDLARDKIKTGLKVKEGEARVGVAHN